MERRLAGDEAVDCQATCSEVPKDVASDCLKPGENTVTENGKTVATVHVAEKGQHLNFTTSNGASIGATFTGRSGEVTQALVGKGPQSIGEISQRTNGTLEGTGFTTGLGPDSSRGSVFDFMGYEQELEHRAMVEAGAFEGVAQFTAVEELALANPAAKLAGALGSLVLRRATVGGAEAMLAATRGPGAFSLVSESMSARAALYQSKVTGTLPDIGYIVDGVKFDGFRSGVLLDAKGFGYARFVKDGEFKRFFGGADSLVQQAQRQAASARGTPIQWHFAEEAAAGATRTLLERRGVSGIEVLYTPL